MLRQHAEGDDFLEALLDDALARAHLSPADRALTQELTCGVVRWQSALDWIIAQKAREPRLHPRVRMVLRLGLYQIFFLDRVPDHAAVHETVELAKNLHLTGQAGFINAVLRGCLRERASLEGALEELKRQNPALGWSQPDWLVARWTQRWGGEITEQLLAWNNTPPVTYARLNTLRGTAGDLTAAWDKEGVRFAARSWDWTGDGLVFELRAHPALASLPSFRQGRFYVQDPGTLLAVRLLDPQPGDAVLDLCAAPGGKTTFAAALMRNQGRIIANEPDARRRELIRENCTRLGVNCVRIVTPGPIQLPDTVGPFDRALVDVPCSNTGVMRRRVDLRWRIRADEVTALTRTQLELLRRAAAELRPGGVLVYSTCSLEPEENDAVVRAFLAARSDFRLETERQLQPWRDGVDGAYVAKLVKA